MVYGAVVLLAVDLLLMGGILYIIASRKNIMPETLLLKSAQGGGETAGLAELKRELNDVKKATARMEKREQEFLAFEKKVEDKHKKLESILTEAEESFRNNALMYSAQITGDNYSRAMALLKMGTPADEIIKQLGLLNGEVELISALNNYRV